MGQPEQDSQNRTARMGQPRQVDRMGQLEQDNQNRTGPLAQDCQDWTAGTITVPDQRRRIHLEVVLVRRWASGVLGIRRGEDLGEG
jgi:hypothetical protein